MFVIQGLADRPPSSLRTSSLSLVTQFIRHKSKTHYEVLGLETAATPDDIRKAFIELSKQLHPDVNKNDPKTHEKFVRVNEAYMILSKPMDRREYDLNLATRVYNQQQAGRNVYGSHVHTSSHKPGSNFEQGEGDERIFWDETIWYMRDRSKDRQHQERSYYGFRGMRRLPNSYILGGCFGLMTIGAILHYLAVTKTSSMHRKVLDAKDMKYSAMHNAAKSQAKTHGNVLQLRILKARILKKDHDDIEPDSVSSKKE